MHIFFRKVALNKNIIRQKWLYPLKGRVQILLQRIKLSGSAVILVCLHLILELNRAAEPLNYMNLWSSVAEDWCIPPLMAGS